MQSETDKEISELCSQGINLEEVGMMEEAANLFQQAWKNAKNDFEKFTSAHYLAKHQPNTTSKLKWDETALEFALKINTTNVKQAYPSLYLNIAKCYEDLGDVHNARKYYQSAFSFTNCLPNNGYGNMIKAGIANGITRVQ